MTGSTTANPCGNTSKRGPFPLKYMTKPLPERHTYTSPCGRIRGMHFRLEQGVVVDDRPDLGFAYVIFNDVMLIQETTDNGQVKHYACPAEPVIANDEWVTLWVPADRYKGLRFEIGKVFQHS